MPQRFSIINQHLSTRRQPDYKGHAQGGGKPTINPVSNVLSYKDEYANHNVFERLNKGRDKVVKATRLERRMNPNRGSGSRSSQQQEADNQEAEEHEGEEENQFEGSPESDYKLASKAGYSSAKVHRFEENVVHEEDEYGDEEQVEEY